MSYLREQIIKSFKEKVYSELGYHKEILLPEEEILIEIAQNSMHYYLGEISAIQDQLKFERNNRINFKNMMDDLIQENEELKKEIKKRNYE